MLVVQNRRSAPRVRSMNPVVYVSTRRERRKASISMGKRLDLSPSGVRIQVSTGLEDGDSLELEIGLEIGAGEKLIQAKARVVCQRRLGSAGSRRSDRRGLFGDAGTRQPPAPPVSLTGDSSCTV